MTTTFDAEAALFERRATSDYAELSRRIKAAGLLRRRRGRYAMRGLLLLGGFVVAFLLLFTLESTWWQLGVATLFGVLFTQCAFLAHDAAHRQIFGSGKSNERFSRLLGNLVVGLSYGWWAHKHSRHHANPNKLGKDDDIATGALVFDPEHVAERTGIVGWITRRQGWLFFPMLTLEGLNLHVSAVRTIAGRPDLKSRGVEAVLITVRLLGFPALLAAVLGPATAAAFLGVQLAVFGVYMGACFAPSHKGMPLIGKDVSIDFLRRQALTSRNIRGGRAMDWAMGGLNLQIEHHLFPSMPSMSLRRARPIVRDYCAERGVPYTETGLFAAYRIVVRFLNEVGLGRRDPFECPFVAQYRSR